MGVTLIYVYWKIMIEYTLKKLDQNCTDHSGRAA
jgi:hypothetical protein